MPIQIRPMVDPLSPWAQDPPIVAQCNASRLLQKELVRYCSGQIEGRSFLIAGHRGSGKTTMVHSVIRAVRDMALPTIKIRPLPIFLHGPSLFRPPGEAAPTAVPSPPAAASPDQEQADDVQARIERHAQHALIQVILGLHKAVAREFADAYRERVTDALNPASHPAGSARELDTRLPRRELPQDPGEWYELAAQFEIELMEDPRTSRLREFYANIDAVESGVLPRPLLSTERPSDQGARELVALNGICMAHQRISGTMSGQVKESSKHSLEQEKTLGWRFGELVKPLVAVLSGSLAIGGAAAGQHGLLASAALGIATAVGAGVVFDHASKSTIKLEREVDHTFIPDLSLRTLDRVLPMLVKRLINAGLAPVLVIDELDKMEELSQRLGDMAQHLKKLLSENVFSCFLTDRSYLEHITHSEREKAYGKIYSYFTHASFVCYEPRDFDDYFSKLFQPLDQGDFTAQTDIELLKWLLRHRSQMHALELSREILSVSVRGEPVGGGPSADIVDIPAGSIRESRVYTIDITFQVAIEHELRKPDVMLWMQQSPARRLTLMDALYFISREWRKDARELDLSDTGIDAMWRKLEKRMNLDEVTDQKADGANAPATQDGTPPIPQTPSTVLQEGEKDMLRRLVRSLARELSQPSPAFRQQSSIDLAIDDVNRRSVPVVSPVIECILQGDESVLIADASREHCYRFRFPSSELVKPDQAATAAAQTEPAAPAGVTAEAARPAATEPAAAPLLTFIDALEKALQPYFFDPATTTVAPGHVFEKLADDLGILPIREPAKSMQEARARLQLTQPDDAYAERSSDVQRLGRFADLLRRDYPTIQAALSIAAGIAGLRQPAPDRTAVGKALSVLSTGLRFRSDTARVSSLLDRLQTDLHEIFPPFPSEFAWRAAPELDPAELIAETVEVWTKFAERSRGVAEDKWPRLINEAWSHFSVDARGRPRGHIPLAVTLCVANECGPARYFKRNPFNPPVEDWTRLVLQVFKAATSTDAQEIPKVMLSNGLLVMGFNVAPGDAVMNYLSTLDKKMLKYKNEIAFITTQRGSSDVRRRGPAIAVAVILKTDPTSLATDPIAVSRLQPLLVTSCGELEDAPDELLRFIALTGNVMLIFDGPTESAFSSGIADRMRLIAPQVNIDVAPIAQTPYANYETSA